MALAGRLSHMWRRKKNRYYRLHNLYVIGPVLVPFGDLFAVTRLHRHRWSCAGSNVNAWKWKLETVRSRGGPLRLRFRRRGVGIRPAWRSARASSTTACPFLFSYRYDVAAHFRDRCACQVTGRQESRRSQDVAADPGTIHAGFPGLGGPVHALINLRCIRKQSLRILLN